MNHKIVLVPAYNELENLRGLCGELQGRAGPDWDIMVIDDGSADKTGEWLEKNRVPYLRLPFNCGIGGAMHAGYCYAYENGYQYALQLDGDGQHPPSEIRRLDAEMQKGGADMVIGSRFFERTSYETGVARAAGIFFFRWLVKQLTGIRIADPTSGFRLINRKIMEMFHDDYPSDYPEVDTLIRVLGEGYGVREISVNMSPRKYGKTSIHPWAAFFYMSKVPFSILLFFRHKRYGRKNASDSNHDLHR